MISGNRKIFLLAGPFLSLFGFAIAANAIPPLITTMAAEFGESLGSMGLLVGLQYLSFAVAAFSGGFLVGKLKIKPSSLVLAGLFVLILAFFGSAYFTKLWLFLIWAVPFGFAGGLVEAFSSVIISQNSRTGSSKLMTFSQLFYCLGALFAPQLVSVLLKFKWTWQQIMTNFGIIMSVVLAVFFLLNLSSKNADTKEKLNENTAVDNTDGLSAVYKDKMFWMTGLMLFFYVVVELTTICWLPAYFQKNFGLSTDSAAWRLSLLWGGFVIGRILILFLPERWTLWPTAIVSTILMAVASVGLHMSANSSYASVFSVIMGLAAGPLWPVIVMIAHHLGSREGFVASVIGFGALGAAIGPITGGVVINKAGIGNLFIVMVLPFVLINLYLILKMKKLYKLH